MLMISTYTKTMPKLCGVLAFLKYETDGKRILKIILIVSGMEEKVLYKKVAKSINIRNSGHEN